MPLLVVEADVWREGKGGESGRLEFSLLLKTGIFLVVRRRERGSSLLSKVDRAHGHGTTVCKLW